MFDFLTSTLGLGTIALIGIILFMLYMKLMKWVFKIALLGIALLAAYWYLKPAVGS